MSGVIKLGKKICWGKTMAKTTIVFHVQQEATREFKLKRMAQYALRFVKNACGY